MEGILSGNPEQLTATPENQKELENAQFSQWKDRAYEVLQVMEYIEVSENGDIYCDLDKFREFEGRKFRENMTKDSDLEGGSVYSAQKVSVPIYTKYGRDSFLAIYNLFGDQPVYAKGFKQYGPRKLVYIPQTRKEVYSVETLREDDSWLAPFEIGRTKDTEYPSIEEEYDSGLNRWEVNLAYITYNRRFGNGKREVIGGREVLMVNWPDGTRREVTSEFYKEWGYYGTPDSRSENNTNVIDRIVEFVNERTPDLLDHDLLREEDFKVQYGSATYDRYGFRPRRCGSDGSVFIDGVKYYVGKEYSPTKGNFTVHKISSDFAAIVSSDSQKKPVVELIFPLDITDVPDIGVTTSGRGGTYNYVQQEKLTTFSRDEFVRITEGSELLINFEKYLELAEQIQKEIGIVLHRFSLVEQSAAVSIYEKYAGSEQFWGFVRKYELDGLRVLMVVRDVDGADTALFLGRTEPTVARRIFREAARIMEITSLYEDGARKEVSKRQEEYVDDVTEVVLEHATRLILASRPVLEGKVPGMEINDVTYEVIRFRERVEGMYERRFGKRQTEGEYQDLLNMLEETRDDPNSHAVVLQRLERKWMDEARQESDPERLKRILDTTNRFYEGYEDLFEKASETTGDTEEELRRLRKFLTVNNVSGTVIDIGSGEGSRITKKMAESLEGRAKVIGIDLGLPKIRPMYNLEFLQADVTKLPFAGSVASVVTANWSVLNDLISRDQQLSLMSELRRVMQKGGLFYCDVPNIEGGEGSWEKEVRAQAEQQPHLKRGQVSLEFPGNRTKEFYMYPESELVGLLEANGFKLTQKDNWVTQAGKPRSTYVFELVDKLPPSSI